MTVEEQVATEEEPAMTEEELRRYQAFCFKEQERLQLEMNREVQRMREFVKYGYIKGSTIIKK